QEDVKAIIIKEMKFEQANKISDNFIEKLMQNVSKQNRTPHIYHRLFGTNTDQGAVNQLPQLIEDIPNRVYIKGRAGTGKSVFLNKIIQSCTNDGFDIEQYHCSFDPGSTDMFLVPALHLCIFDSTVANELMQDRSDDVVIDLYEEIVTTGRDEKYDKEIRRITEEYKAVLREGIDDLKEAKFWQNEIEGQYEHWEKPKVNAIVED